MKSGSFLKFGTVNCADAIVTVNVSPGSNVPLAGDVDKTRPFAENWVKWANKNKDKAVSVLD